MQNLSTGHNEWIYQNIYLFLLFLSLGVQVFWIPHAHAMRHSKNTFCISLLVFIKLVELPVNFLNINEDLEILARTLIRWKLEVLSINSSAINSFGLLI